MHQGSCLCGAVKLEVDVTHLPKADACHCTKCRKWTGHVGVGVEVPRDRVAIEGEDAIRWFASSDKARRGFCGTCGTSLFFDPLDKVKHSWTGVYMGLFDGPTQTEIGLHMFVAEKGDYYEINDDAQQNEY
ncbi:MAG: GFA family protein [Alphaproteobacteria bacterium]|nr:GFA family protein [Alphaproteobacteria bacterium]